MTLNRITSAREMTVRGDVRAVDPSKARSGGSSVLQADAIVSRWASEERCGALAVARDEHRTAELLLTRVQRSRPLLDPAVVAGISGRGA